TTLGRPGWTRLTPSRIFRRPATTCNRFCRRSALHVLTRRKSRGPARLKMEAAQVAGNVHYFADEVESGDAMAFKGFGRKLGSVHAARCDFGLLEPFSAGRLHVCLVKRMCDRVDL